jgi:benzoyl-CoA reductase/2-hydroxyglutaryl-CoA dehydratase subunit BcrC/BadD/HgdB
MTVAGRLKYGVAVDLIGKVLLRWQRRAQERRWAKRTWRGDHLAPPLQCSPQLKELISRHYLAGRYANGARPVAWVTSGAPIEYLAALDYHLHYPENHGAVCGIQRLAESPQRAAEDAGWSQDLCSYARTDIGTVLTGETPVGSLPRPDLLVACTNICQTVLLWYRVLADHFDCPLVIIDTPFIYGPEAPEHAVPYVRAQIEGAMETAERVAGRSIDPMRLEQATRWSKEAVDLWAAVMDTGRAHPSPLTAFDEFIHMAPIVEMRGQEFTVRYYATMLAELEQRIQEGVGALEHERKRVLWDNLPVWYRMRWLGERLAEDGVAMVGSTYTNAWAELGHMIDPSDPVGSTARCYLHPTLNRATAHKMEVLRQMVADFDCDGVILHSNRSCKPYSVGQVDQRDRLVNELGVPALLLEADHNDARAFAEEQVETRLQAFFEMLE